MAIAGQMIVGTAPVTFCLSLNWHERDGSEATVVAAYKQAVTDVLSQVRRELLKA